MEINFHQSTNSLIGNAFCGLINFSIQLSSYIGELLMVAYQCL